MIKRQANRDRWIALPPGPIDDASLSWAGRGLLLYLLAKPDDWEVRVQQLIAASPDGKKKVQAALRELKSAGYMILITMKAAKSGKVKGKQWIVSDTPQNRQRPNGSFGDVKGLPQKSLDKNVTDRPQNRPSV